MLILKNSYKLSLKLIFNLIFYFYYAYSSGKIKGDSKQTGWSFSRVFTREFGPSWLVAGPLVFFTTVKEVVYSIVSSSPKCPDPCHS